MGLIKKKIVMVGESMVGKTSLLLVRSDGPEFADVNYMPNPLTTVHSVHNVVVDVDGQQLKLALHDTSGAEDYERLRPLLYRGADVIVMCFSFNSSISLENIVPTWMSEVARFCPGVPIILVGTMTDLKGRRDPETVTSMEEVQKVIDAVEPYAYIESSVAKRQGIDIIFTTAARAALESKYVKKEHKCCIVS